LTEPGGGIGLTIEDPHGRLLRIVHGDRLAGEAGDSHDRPLRLAHVVLNCRKVAVAQGFLETVLGFRLIDRTRAMAFMNCNRDHHSIALADADNDALNHIAFLMPDLESVMRGGGRLKEVRSSNRVGARTPRGGKTMLSTTSSVRRRRCRVHGPEVEQVDDSYRVGTPDSWGWPAGRFDHWGNFGGAQRASQGGAAAGSFRALGLAAPDLRPDGATSRQTGGNDEGDDDGQAPVFARGLSQAPCLLRPPGRRRGPTSR
jgi:catechol 2,3-dioxygenase